MPAGKPNWTAEVRRCHRSNCGSASISGCSMQFDAVANTLARQVLMLLWMLQHYLRLAVPAHVAIFCLAVALWLALPSGRLSRPVSWQSWSLCACPTLAIKTITLVPQPTFAWEALHSRAFVCDRCGSA